MGLYKNQNPKYIKVQADVKYKIIEKYGLGLYKSKG